MKKGFVVFVVFLFTAISIFHFNLFELKDKTYKNYPNLELRRHLFDKIPIKEHWKNDFKRRGIALVANDYNVKFIPETQFIKVKFDKKKINFSKSFMEKHQPDSPSFKSFYLEILKDKIWIVDYLGSIYHFDIAVAKINFQYLNFDNFFNPNECAEFIQGGRMQFYKHNKDEGLLLTTSDSPNDRPNEKPQSNHSIYGKILFIDFKNKNSLVFSKGHRNQQGLYVDNDLILTTEHGPRSGDEINKILFNKNYGWPISSYGEKYSTYDNDKPIYLKNHASEGFEEPIFAFVPAIGISEIIKLPNSFSKHFIDNFIISSLYGRSLHRIKFDKKFNKIFFNEKIFLGERIRDLKYYDEIDAILLALEDKGELGILSNYDD